ncbi:hypothetical protein [Oribacterium sp. P9]|uniref:hypothetical protein n=1 Tax=Oribacterium sp. P9 TaxID=3378068 RepID=UPI0039676C69
MGVTRKTVLFIVEGPSDKAALEKIFQTIYRRNKDVEFKFTEGDITSDPNLEEILDSTNSYEQVWKNVEKQIYQTVQEYMRERKLNKRDIFHVIQLFDTDGAYIPETAIINGPTYGFQYSLTTISCTNPERAKKRNRLKADILNHLQKLHEIEGLPYEMYYMSCNLDHALYNEQNLDKDDKQAYADQFYEKFLGKEYLFPEFLKTDVVNGVPNSVPESWKYIKEGVHSLERHTNLHIYFTKYPTPDGLL